MASPLSLKADVKPPHTGRSNLQAVVHWAVYTPDNCHAYPSVALESLNRVSSHLSPSLNLSPENPLRATRKADYNHKQVLSRMQGKENISNIYQVGAQGSRAGAFRMTDIWNLKKEQRDIFHRVLKLF